MTAFALNHFWAYNRPLIEEVRDSGIRHIDADQAERHMRQVMVMNRSTWTTFALGWLFQLSWLLSLQPVLKMLWPEHSLARRAGNTFVLNFALSLVAIFIWSVGLGWVLYVPFMAMLAMCVLVLIEIVLVEVLESHPPFSSFWSSHHPDAWERSGNGLIPGSLCKRMKIASNITGARIRVIADLNDPFIVVERGFGPLKQRVYIGAWDTGTAMDNI